MKVTQNIRPQLSNLLQSSLLVFLARLFGAAIGLIIQIVLARSIGGEQLGLVYIALAIANVGSVIAALGYPSVSVRFLRRYQVKKADERAVFFRRQSVRDVLIASLFLMVVIAVIITFLSFANKDYLALYWSVLMIPVFALLALNGGVANAFQRIDISYVPDVFIRPLSWFVLLVVGVGFGWVMNATDVVFTAFIATFIAFFIQWYWMRSSIENKSFYSKEDDIPIKRQLSKLWRLAAMPMIAMTLLTNMIFDIDVLVLSFLLTNEELALFGIAFKIAFLIGFGVHVIQQAAYPRITDAYAVKNNSLMRKEILSAVIPGTVGSILSIILIMFFGHWILQFFGPDFEAALPVLLLLSICTFIRAISGPSSQILVLAGKQKQMLMIYGSGVFLLAGLNLILVPVLGGNGAALALVLITIYWSVFLSVCAFRSTGVRVDGVSKEIFVPGSFFNHPFQKNGMRF